MAENAPDKRPLNSIGTNEAFQLSDVVKTPPIYGMLTPRWLSRALEMKGLQTGVYRVNRVVEGETPLDVLCSLDPSTEEIPQGYVKYDNNPKEYHLVAVSTIINVDTHVSDVYNEPYNQVDEQINLAVESLKERQESQIINNGNYGLLKCCANSQRVDARGGSPTPDLLDELLAKVWKEPSFFLAHPRAIAAFERECTRRGVPPETTSVYGGVFIKWRGVPILPTDKCFVDGKRNPGPSNGKTNVILLRTGEARRGVIGLYQSGLPNEKSRGMSVRLRGIDDNGIASYLLSLYCSAAILSDDAIAVLENTEVGVYHDYK
ncbi:MAG: hypothetical protein LBL96_08870 [Clostridiales bacterium]|jgi:hypothetical protein|nr:hypothetical protein [Clostridiales bacterium]